MAAYSFMSSSLIGYKHWLQDWGELPYSSLKVCCASFTKKYDHAFPVLHSQLQFYLCGMSFVPIILGFEGGSVLFFLGSLGREQFATLDACVRIYFNVGWPFIPTSTCS